MADHSPQKFRNLNDLDNELNYTLKKPYDFNDKCLRFNGQKNS